MNRMPRRVVHGLNPAALAHARRARGLTQDDLGLQLGVTSQSIHTWESGRSKPGPQNFKRLLDILQVTKDELVMAEAVSSLAAHRQRAGLTQLAAVEASGILKHRLLDIERGVRLPTRDETQKLARAYGISVKEVQQLCQALHDQRTRRA